MTNIPPLFFVLQRNDGEWGPAAKIISRYPTEELAEARAAKEKLEHPQQHFAVSALRSEARTVLNPVEIIMVGEN